MPGLGLSSLQNGAMSSKKAKSTDLQLLPPPTTRRGSWEASLNQGAYFPRNVPPPTYRVPSSVAISNSNGSSSNNNGSNGRGGSVEKPKLDPSDPQVKKLVYSMYRDMLTTYNGEANDIIGKKDPTNVIQDSGVGPILESIVMKQRGAQSGGASDISGPAAASVEGQLESGSGSSNGNHSTMPPPPPPPPMMPGALPAVRLRSEIGPRDTGPPAALASAMMKDKKPFTYTPGGIDLSEIRSPRMAKRIQMNAAAEGVTNTPSPSVNQDRPPAYLPPAALAAMQPQMAIPVFPQGNNGNVQLSKSHRAAEYASQPPPPPPPPMMMAPTHIGPQTTTASAPAAAPLSPHLTLQPTSPASPQPPKSPTPARTPPPPPERAITPVTLSPVPPPMMDFGSSVRPSNQFEGRKSPAMVEAPSGVGTGSLFIPPIQPSTTTPQSSPQLSSSSASPISTYVPPSARSPGQSKAQAVSQNIGTLYIPPIPSNAGSNQQNMGASGDSGPNVNRAPYSAQQQQQPQTVQQPQFTPNTSTPQLNKAPVPWMNSYNRIQNQQTDSPPYVHPAFFMPPWGPPPGARTIPIMKESDQADGAYHMHGGPGVESRRSSSASGGSTPSGSRTPSQAATHLGRVIPIQIEREEAAKAKGAKIIPIQIEGRPPRAQTPSTPMTPMMNPMRRPVGPAMFNSPIGLYSNQNAMDAYQRQAAEVAAGVDRMNVRCESPRTEPMQSKSLKVIQQAAENVDKGSSMLQTAEPRFMGSHIPSKAFRALQTALPAGPGAQDQQPQSFTPGSGGPVTHHIPIRQVAQSPTPQQSQASEIQIGSQQPNVPPSEQKVQEPKKYMGSNIPSRSFKILQQMTSDDGQPAVGSAETAFSPEEQNIADSYTDDYTTSPYQSAENIPEASLNSLYASFPLSPSFSSEGGGFANYDLYNSFNSSNNNISNIDCYNNGEGDKNNDDSCQNNDNNNTWSGMVGLDPQSGWDPYSYMWYYWWYYSTCYWAGYDMSGYEYPAGWDPNYPYCPPEFFTDCSTPSSADWTTATEDREESLSNLESMNQDSLCPRDTHKSLNTLKGESSYNASDNNISSSSSRDNGRFGFSQEAPAPHAIVPRIVIGEGEKEEEEAKNKNLPERNGSVDRIKDNSHSHSRQSQSNKYNDNNESNFESSSNSSGGTSQDLTMMSQLTESNRKSRTPISYKRNGCDSMYSSLKWKENENFAECNNSMSSGSSEPAAVPVPTALEERKDFVKERKETSEDSSPSSSDDEYESCCEDPEQKVIERETAPFNNKPFVSRDYSVGTVEHQQKMKQSELTHQRKYDNHDSYRSEELNANADPNFPKESNGLDEYKGKVEEAPLDEEDEETDPGADEDNDEEDDDDDYGGNLGIVEEPETPSSADDSDIVQLTQSSKATATEQRELDGKSYYYNGGGVSIEEYNSEESSESTSTVFDYGPRKNRLSTIDEMTESRASSSSLLSSCATPTNLIVSPGPLKNILSNDSSSKHRGQNNKVEKENEGKDICDSEDSEETSEDELSSVSVIENKSDATRGTESKREDETTSTSEDDSEDEDDDDEKENDEADTAVTVRLPLKLCFTKTKSYKDITTVMVGDSEIEEATTCTSAISPPYSQSSNHSGENETTRGNKNDDDNHDHDSAAPGDDDDNLKKKRITSASAEKAQDDDEEEEEDEPVVSFTLSLSRQTSREDETKLKEGRNEKTKDESGSLGDDIDFWAEITKGEENWNEKSIPTTTTSSTTSCNKSLKEEKNNQGNKEDFGGGEADVSFWGVITRDRSTSDFPRKRNVGNVGKRENEKEERECGDEMMSLSKLEDFQEAEEEDEDHQSNQWDPYESIDYKWEKDFNFWEKSSRTIETRRFSGNFEISEDYESDSGIKPSTVRKERTKKYTHHKRHSIPGPSWDRSSLPPRPNSKQLKDSMKNNSNTEQEIKGEDEKRHVMESRRSGSGKRESNNNNAASWGERSATNRQEDCDTSSWWSYWDEVTQQSQEEKFQSNNNAERSCWEAGATLAQARKSKSEKPAAAAAVHSEGTEVLGSTSTTSPQQENGEESSTELSLKIKLSGMDTGESISDEYDYQSFASEPLEHLEHFEHNVSSHLEERRNVGAQEEEGEDSSNEVKDLKNLNHSCQSDAATVTTENENYSSSPEIKSPPPLQLPFPYSTNSETEKLIQRGFSSVSDENSDESSSRSSGTTIEQNNDKSKQIAVPSSSSSPPTTVEAVVPSSNTRDSNNSSLDEDQQNKVEVEQRQDDDDVDDDESSKVEIVDTSVQIPLTIERNIEIQHESGERSKLNEQHQNLVEEQLYCHHHHHHHFHNATTSAINSTSSTTTTSCTCLIGDRIARAENLLWRIERFLHESLSLGSEDDSGVMTDLSRQISDVDTDVDNDLNETEFLLTAAAAVKERRGMASTNCTNTNESQQNQQQNQNQHIESCNFAETISSTDGLVNQSHQQQQSKASTNTNTTTSPTPQTHNQQQQQSVKKPRPKSDIFLESTVLSKVETEEEVTTTTTTSTTENNGVRMRSASERRALRYQRAKTHSRLFQLLQDECGRDEDLEEFDYDSDVTCSKTTNNNVVECQISVDTSAAAVTNPHSQSEDCPDGRNVSSSEDDCINNTTSTSPTRMNEAQARRSRLLPLPIKNLLASSLSLDSNSSPSGSSGVLSPTSPVNRDQLLADIINEFHMRNQVSTVRAQSQRRVSSSFPSKVFKLLQHEFGEEFYQTFDCCGGAGNGSGKVESTEDCFISPSMSNNLCGNDSGSSLASCCGGGPVPPIVHECRIHKSESMKEFEEATSRILTNFMLRNSKLKPTSSESLCSTAISPRLHQTQDAEDSKNNAEFLEVPLRRKKGNNLNRDAKSLKSTK